jgi:hypothetical protein
LSENNRIGIGEQELGKENGFLFFSFSYLTRDGPFTAAQGRYFPGLLRSNNKKK